MYISILSLSFLLNWSPTMNIWKLWTPFLIHKNINLLKTEMEGHETALCCHTHIYLSSKILQVQIIVKNSTTSAKGVWRDQFSNSAHQPLHHCHELAYADMPIMFCPLFWRKEMPWLTRQPWKFPRWLPMVVFWGLT